MISLQQLLAGACLAFCLTAPALAGQTVTLKDVVLADGPVTLGDLFEGAGRAENVVVLPAPPAGGSVMIDAGQLQRTAMVNGLSWSNERGLRRVIVRAGATAAAVPQTETVKAPAGKGVEVLTWTRSIAAGEMIQAEDLGWTTLPAAPAGAARDADTLIGKIAKKPLRLGAAAAGRDVGAARVIDKDDLISVVYSVGGVTLTLQAKAMGPAATGELFTVSNTQSKKAFQAVATGPGRAVVGPEANTVRSSQTLALR